MAVPARTPGAGLRAMSTTFSQIEHRILLNQDLSDGAVRLYGLIAMHEFLSESGECNISHAQLAAETGKAERTIRALLKELADAGLIDWRAIPGMGQAKAYRTLGASGKNLPLALVVQRPEPSLPGGTKRRKSASSSENTPSKRQKTAAQLAEKRSTKRQNSAAVIKDPVNTRVKTEETPTELRSSGGGGKPPAPPAEPAQLADVPQGKTARRPLTEAPETLELTPSMVAYAARYGFDEDRARLEIDACLSYYGADDAKHRNWVRVWQKWIAKQRVIDDERAQRFGALRNGKAAYSTTNGERAWTGKPGSPVSTDAREFARRTDWDL